MKKLIMFLMAATFVVSATAQDLVYDYKASFSAIGASYQKISYSVVGYDRKGKDVLMYEGYFDTFDKVKDSLKGYLVISVCYDCNEDYGTQTFPSTGDLYVQRKGDKLFSDVYVLEVETAAAMFNKGVGSRVGDGELGGSPTSLKKLKGAWMTIAYPTIPAYYDDVEVDLKQTTSTQTTSYGFLGYQNVAAFNIGNCGFGKVDVITDSQKGSLDFCGGIEGFETSCTIVKSISGSMCGNSAWDGICAETPMWDICDIMLPVSTAPVSGTWSIKLNKKLTSQYNAAGEDAILDRFKNVTNVIYVDQPGS